MNERADIWARVYAAAYAAVYASAKDWNFAQTCAARAAAHAVEQWDEHQRL